MLDDMSWSCRCGKEFPTLEERTEHSKKCGKIRETANVLSSNLTRHLIRKRLIAIGLYTEVNVEKAFKYITKNGADFSGVLVTSRAENIKIFDEQLGKAIREEA